MFQRKPRKFRHRMDNRGGLSHGNGNALTKLRSHSFSNGQTRNKFRTTLSAEQLFEKYKALAKEAMSSGDSTLYENYLQHADHFVRIIEDKNRNQGQHKPNLVHKPAGVDKHLSQKNVINQDHATDNKK